MQSMYVLLVKIVVKGGLTSERSGSVSTVPKEDITLDYDSGKLTCSCDKHCHNVGLAEYDPFCDSDSDERQLLGLLSSSESESDRGDVTKLKAAHQKDVGGASGGKTGTRVTFFSSDDELDNSTADNPVMKSAARVRTNPPRELC